MKVLVVDDDEKLTRVLAAYLAKESMEADIAVSGLAALEKMRQNPPDVILLDIMLPDLDGWTVCREIRRTSNVPIIMLTAMSGEDERVSGLEMGADDYVTKPFSPREVIARIRALARRTQLQPADPAELSVLRMGGMELNRIYHTLTINNQALELTPTEFKLLELFMSHPGQVFSRLQLVEYTQGQSYEGYERTMDSHIKNLRKKLDNAAGNAHSIQTVYGLGYKMTGEQHA